MGIEGESGMESGPSNRTEDKVRACGKAALGGRREVTELDRRQDRLGKEARWMGQTWKGKKREAGGGACVRGKAVRNTGQMGGMVQRRGWRKDETVSRESLEFEFGTGSCGAGSDEAESRQRPQGLGGHSCSRRVDHECPGSMCESMPACGWVCKCVCACLPCQSV